MKTKFFALIHIALAGAVILLSSAAKKPLSGTDSWLAPKEADALKNPVAGNTDAIAKGKILYNTYCNVCHGNLGKGDGVAGKGIYPRPADHTSAKVQSQSDGAIFWKLTYGRPPMAAYKDLLKEGQRWQLVSYIRELGKQSTSSTKN